MNCFTLLELGQLGCTLTLEALGWPRTAEDQFTQAEYNQMRRLFTVCRIRSPGFCLLASPRQSAPQSRLRLGPCASQRARLPVRVTTKLASPEFALLPVQQRVSALWGSSPSCLSIRAESACHMCPLDLELLTETRGLKTTSLGSCRFGALKFYELP